MKIYWVSELVRNTWKITTPSDGILPIYISYIVVELSLQIYLYLIHIYLPIYLSTISTGTAIAVLDVSIALTTIPMMLLVSHSSRKLFWMRVQTIIQTIIAILILPTQISMKQNSILDKYSIYPSDIGILLVLPLHPPKEKNNQWTNKCKLISIFLWDLYISLFWYISFKR